MPYKVGHVLEKEKGTAKQFTFIAIWFNTEVNTKMSKERDCTVITILQKIQINFFKRSSKKSEQNPFLKIKSRQDSSTATQRNFSEYD